MDVQIRHLRLQVGEIKRLCMAKLRKEVKATVAKYRSNKSNNVDSDSTIQELFSNTSSSDSSCTRNSKKQHSKRILNRKIGMRKCSYCLAEFVDAKQYQKHILIHKPELAKSLNTQRRCRLKKIYTCDCCSDVFNNVKMFEVHMRKKHPEMNSIVFCCPLCDRTCNSAHGLFNHQSLHQIQETYHCGICEENFTTVFLYTIHHNEAHANAPKRVIELLTRAIENRKINALKGGKAGQYECSSCPQAFDNVKNYESHIRNRHPEESNNTLFACPLCSYTFANAQALLSHQYQHLVKDNYDCSACNGDFATLQLLTIHYNKIHSKATEKVIDELENAMEKLTKTGTPIYPCQHCRVQYETLTTLKDHMLVHEQEFLEGRRLPYHCPICKKQFAWANMLIGHRKQHETASEFKCDCNKGFNRLDTLIIHYNKEHADMSENLIDILKIIMEKGNARSAKDRNKIRRRQNTCNLCSKTFYEKRTFVDHMTEHAKVRDPLLQFHCPLCDSTFDNAYGLPVHEHSHGNTKCTLACPISSLPSCREEHDTFAALVFHHHQDHLRISNEAMTALKGVFDVSRKRLIREDRVARRAYSCQHCQRRCTDFRNLCDHVLDHMLEKAECIALAFTCPLCTEKYDTIWKLLFHVADHDKCSNVKCKHCDEILENRDLLTIHHYKTHFKTNSDIFDYIFNLLENYFGLKTDPDIPEIKPITCITCSAKFAYRNDYYAHKKEVHGSDRFNCKVCGRKLSSAATLKNHMKIMHSERKPSFCCDKCGKQLLTKKGLEKHFRGHMNKKKHIECKVCAVKFSSYSTYQTHFAVKHLQRRDFVCDVCGKEYGSAPALYQHRIMVCDKDNAQKGYCKLCDRTFENTRILYYHKTNFHKHGNTEDTSCHICNKTFLSEASLWCHNRQKHTELTHITCAVCGVIRPNRHLAFEHWLIHSPEPAFSCTACNLQFKQICGVYQHRRLKHKNTDKSLIGTDVEMLNALKKMFEETHPSEDFNRHRRVLDDGVVKGCQAESAHRFRPEVDNSLVESIEEEDQQFGVRSEAPAINYIDYSKANVPEESLKLVSNFYEHQESDNNHISAVSELILPAEAKTSEPAFSNSIVSEVRATDSNNKDNSIDEEQTNGLEDDVMNGDFDFPPAHDDYGSNSDLEDIKPATVPLERFPDDPFLERLIVKLSKLKEYNCSSCYKIFYQSSHYENHTKTKGHRLNVREQRKIEKKEMKLIKREAPISKQERTTKKGSKKGKTSGEVKDEDVEKRLVNRRKMPCRNKCEQCSQTFTSFKKLKSHRLVHKSQHQCSLCQDKLPSIPQLKEHYKLKHDGEMLVKCSFCTISFLSQRSLIKHLGELHQDSEEAKKLYGDLRKGLRPRTLKKGEDEEERSLVCKVCGKQFQRFATLNIHRRLHTGERPYACEHCDKAFISPGSLKEHINQVHFGVKHTCETCNKSFSDIRNLRKHRKTHQSTKPYLCTYCGNGFSSNLVLTRHVDGQHLGLTIERRPKLHQCSMCSFSFVKHTALVKHLNLHDPTRPFACHLCTCRFNFAGNLSLHVKHVHEKCPKVNNNQYTKNRKIEEEETLINGICE